IKSAIKPKMYKNSSYNQKMRSRFTCLNRYSLWEEEHAPQENEGGKHLSPPLLQAGNVPDLDQKVFNKSTLE
uniref:hypothetical protein n=1 Tax=uncultured Acinetobacter sp. TaxID=165433 RepID=UPI00260CEF31